VQAPDFTFFKDALTVGTLDPRYEYTWYEVAAHQEWIPTTWFSEVIARHVHILTWQEGVNPPAMEARVFGGEGSALVNAGETRPGFDYTHFEQSWPVANSWEQMYATEHAVSAGVYDHEWYFRSGAEQFEPWTPGKGELRSAMRMLGAGDLETAACADGAVVRMDGDIDLLKWELQITSHVVPEGTMLHDVPIVVHDGTGAFGYTLGSFTPEFGGPWSKITDMPWLTPGQTSALPVLDGPEETPADMLLPGQVDNGNQGNWRAIDLVAYGGSTDPSVGGDGGLVLVYTTARFDSQTLSIHQREGDIILGVMHDVDHGYNYPSAGALAKVSIPKIRVGLRGKYTAQTPPLYQAQRVWPTLYITSVTTKNGGYVHGLW
jgi:hypothetical protein